MIWRQKISKSPVSMKQSNGQKGTYLRNKANGEDSQKMYEGNKGYRSQYSCKQ